VAAMCRKCLKTATAEARRCSSCGGRIVRFTETGEVVELDAAADEPGLSHGVPPLFSELSAPQDQATPQPNAAGAAGGMGNVTAGGQYTQSQAGLPNFNGAQPANGYCQPGPAGVQPAASVQAAGYSHALNGAQFASPVNSAGSNRGTEDHGISPPLPMGYPYTETGGGPPATAQTQAQPQGTFILPLTQLDDVVSEMLSPFGFESPEPVVEPQAPPQILVPSVESVAPRAQQFVEQAPSPPPVAPPPPVPPPPPPPGLSPPAPPPLFASPQVATAPPTAATALADAAVVHATAAPPVPPPLPQPNVPAAVPGLGIAVPAVTQPTAPASSEPRTKKDRQRKERDVSMAELARDIISISEQDSDTRDASDAANGETGTDPSQVESSRQASSDLIIGPAHKGVRLWRSKNSKDAVDESEGFDPMDELGTAPELDPASGKSRSRGRLRLR
jgi:hypothetical protein